MGSYVLVESRDPFESGDVADAYELARGLAAEGNEVAVFLVQNGVLPARRASKAAAQLSELASSTRVIADDFSLRQRGIGTNELADGIGTATIDDLVDLTVDGGRKVIWH